jgi:tetratricopeptide (TPR) repeat protein
MMSHRSIISIPAQLMMLSVFAVPIFAAVIPAQRKDSETGSGTLRQHIDAAHRAERAGNLGQAAEQYRAFLTQALDQLALEHAQLGDYAKTTAYFDEALELTSDAFQLRLDYAIAALQAGDLQRAETLTRFIFAHPPQKSEDLARTHQILGRILLRMNRDREAKKEMEAAIALTPNFENLYGLAVVCLDMDDEGCATRLFAELQSSFGETPALHMQFGRAYGNSDYSPRAVVEFRKVIAEDPRFPTAHYSLAAALLGTGEDEATMLAAEAELKKELAISPRDFLTYAALGKIAAAHHQYPQAEKYLKKATSLNPRNPDAFLYLGQMYFDTDRPIDAKAALRQAVKLTTDVSRNRYQVQKAHFLLGRILMQEHRAEEAHAEMLIARGLANKGLSKDKSGLAGVMPGLSAPTDPQGASTEITPATESTPQTVDPEASARLESDEQQLRLAIGDSYNNLGVISATGQDYSNALHYFERAARWNPSLDGMDYNLGHAAFMASRFADAILPLSHALHARPSDAGIRSALAISRFMTGDYNGCIEALHGKEEIITSIPQLEYVYAASLVKTGEVSSGKRRLESLEARHPEIAEVHRSLGEVLDRQGERPKAAEELRSAILLNANDPESHYDLGKIDLELGDRSAAIVELESAIRLLPGEPRFHAELAKAYKASLRTADAEKELHIYDALKNSQTPPAETVSGSQETVVSGR